MPGESIRQRRSKALATTARAAAAGHVVDLVDPDDRPLTAEEMAWVFEGIPENTRLTYEAQWKRFIAWCGAHGYRHAPATPNTCVRYVMHHWTVPGRYSTDDRFKPASPNTVKLALAVITVAHRRFFPEMNPPTRHPDVLNAWRSYRDKWLGAGHRYDIADVIDMDQLKQMVATCDRSTLIGRRDAALLLVGFALMARRHVLSNLIDADVRVLRGDLEVRIAKDKRHPDGRIRLIPPDPDDPELCPVIAGGAWEATLEEHEVADGPFLPRVYVAKTAGRILRAPMSGEAINAVVKKRAELANIPGHIVAHTLRASPATLASEYGADAAEIADWGGWEPTSPEVFRYIRAGRRRARNPISAIWAGEAAREAEEREKEAARRARRKRS